MFKNRFRHCRNCFPVWAFWFCFKYFLVELYWIAERREVPWGVTELTLRRLQWTQPLPGMRGLEKEDLRLSRLNLWRTKKKRNFQLTDFLMFILPTIRAFPLLSGKTMVRNEIFQVRTDFNCFMLVQVSHSIFFLKFRVIMNQLLVIQKYCK